MVSSSIHRITSGCSLSPWKRTEYRSMNSFVVANINRSDSGSEGPVFDLGLSLKQEVRGLSGT